MTNLDRDAVDASALEDPPMPDAMIHPRSDELTAFGLGKLPEHAAAAVAAHLECCPACRQAVAGVPSDSFLDKLRAAKPDGASFPPSLSRPGNALSSVGRPAIPCVPCADVPPELVRHPKYLILRELGRGGMGIVYQARHKQMNRPIVIKVIKPSLLDQPGALDRFHREIQAAAQLAHPNIVTAYDAEQVGGLHLLVMEFVPGQSLAEVLEKKGPLPVEKACHYVSQAAVGLHHAYKRNMVHRDIKPSNLMLTPQGRVKILDFGLAKIISESGTRTGITASDSYMGTPEYSSPEQATDARSADIRADIYSLGCTLYCLLAGRPPFNANSLGALLLAHQTQEAQPLPELRPDVPERLWRAVARMLAKEPKRRYQRPKEVALALAPFIKPGSKGGSAPAPDVGSPGKGTVIETESEIEEIVREEPPQALPKDVPARAESSPCGNWMDENGPPNEAEHVGEEAMPPLPAWWKRPGVLAGAFGVSLALILIAILILARNNPDGNAGKGRALNRIGVASVQHTSEKSNDNLKRPGTEPDLQPEPIKEQLVPEPSIAPEKPGDHSTDAQSATPRPPAPTPENENRESPANPTSPDAKKRAAVDGAIAKGVAALRKMQHVNGTWPHKEIGATALAGLTLLECGEQADDTSVQLAADAVRRASLKLTHTYSIALSILFLDRLGDTEDIPLIESLTVRLLAGQTNNGGWTYDCPQISDAELSRLTDKLAQRSEPAGPRKSSEPRVRKRAFKDLPKEIQQQAVLINRGNGIETKTPGDNSNTQFATLGLWVGRRYGLPVERALQRVEIHFRNTQQADGGWLYVNPDPKVKGPQLSSTAAMTCAGLFGLAIASGSKLEIRKERDLWNKKPFDIDKDANLKDGLLTLNKFMAQPPEGDSKPVDRGKAAKIGGRSYYFLWALERMAVALDLKKVGKTDWYEWGVELLLANQQADGSWQGEYAAGGADTCFALLFLKRANLTADLTTLIQGENRTLRWMMTFNVNDSPEYVSQLHGLGAILAVPVREGANGPEYEIVKDLSARPAKLVKKDIKEIQRMIYWMDDKPDSVHGVMSVLGLKQRPKHFLVFMPEALEKKLLQLEIDYLKKRHPGRSEDDIDSTRFRIKTVGGKYVPEVENQQLKEMVPE